MRSLVVQTSFVGDVVLTTPLLSRLAEESEVHVLTTPPGATLLASHPAVSRVTVYDKHGADSGAAGLLRVAGGIRRAGGADRAYLAQGSVRSAMLAVLAGCRRRVGFGTSAGHLLYTECVVYRDDWHHARRLLSLAGHAAAAAPAPNPEHDRGRGTTHGPDPTGQSDIRPSLHPVDSDVAAVQALLHPRDLRDRPLVALAPGSAWGSKRWPGFGPLAELLAPDYDLAIVGSDADAGLAAEIGAALAGAVGSDGARRVIDATGKLSLLGSAELIRRSAALVTNDSAPQHLASAVGTPTLTVFGPTVAGFGFGPLAPGSQTIGVTGLACRPCHRHGPQACPLGHWRCMNEITPAEVDSMIRSLLLAGATT